MVWCWLITLWMRYVFRIRNFSYNIYAKCLLEQNRTQCEHSFVRSFVHLLCSHRRVRKCSFIEWIIWSKGKRQNKPIQLKMVCTLFSVFIRFYRLCLRCAFSIWVKKITDWAHNLILITLSLNRLLTPVLFLSVRAATFTSSILSSCRHLIL